MQSNVMRTNSFSISTMVLLLTLSSAGYARSSMAAEMNTYRAGTPYHHVVAQHHQQCESQCKGDAACRSWNFVRPQPNSASGICEFNSRSARAVMSPISMSGNIRTAADPLMSRAVAGPSHTIKIGSPSPQAKPQRATPSRPNLRRNSTVIKHPQTRVKRLAPPQQTQAQPTNFTRPVSVKRGAQMPRKQSIGKNNMPPPVMEPRQQFSKPHPYQAPQASRAQPMPQNQRSRSPEQLAYIRSQKAQAFKQKQREMSAARNRNIQHQLQKRALQNGHILDDRAPNFRNNQTQQRANQPMAPQHQSRPALAQRRKASADFIPSQMANSQMANSQMANSQRANFRPQQHPAQAPVQKQTPQSFQPMAVQIAPPVQVSAVPSLYGSLHDDLTQGMTAVPRPKTMPDNFSNEDSPLATSRAHPSIDVQSSPLPKALKTSAKRDQSDALAGPKTRGE